MFGNFWLWWTECQGTDPQKYCRTAFRWRTSFASGLLQWRYRGTLCEFETSVYTVPSWYTVMRLFADIKTSVDLLAVAEGAQNHEFMASRWYQQGTVRWRGTHGACNNCEIGGNDISKFINIQKSSSSLSSSSTNFIATASLETKLQGRYVLRITLQM